MSYILVNLQKNYLVTLVKVAVRMFLHTWLDHLEEGFLIYIKVPTVKTCSPLAENIIYLRKLLSPRWV